MKKQFFPFVIFFTISFLFSIYYFKQSSIEPEKENIETVDIEKEKGEKKEVVSSELNKENIIEDTKDDTVIIQSNDSNDSVSNKNNMENDNVGNTNVIEVPQVVENKKTSNQEIKITEQPKIKVEEVRDDIVDTNSFLYSIHNGNIDTSSQDKCLSAGEEIAFLNTVDINYYRCYEVTSTTGKVLGYYLNIFCNSDNCNRYKTQIDLKKYK